MKRIVTYIIYGYLLKKINSFFSLSYRLWFKLKFYLKIESTRWSIRHPFGTSALGQTPQVSPYVDPPLTTKRYMTVLFKIMKILQGLFVIVFLLSKYYIKLSVSNHIIRLSPLEKFKIKILILYWKTEFHTSSTIQI